jgi:putative tryptophan/tyrosine transport system substrate-binding protein
MTPLVRLLTLTLGLLVAPLALNAQLPATMARIGVLHGDALTPERAHRQQAFQQGLHDLGWVAGHNIAIEYRYAEGKFERLPDLAAELVRLNVQVLVVDGTAGAAATKHVTQTVPIVMLHGTDPVEGGVVTSLARPGGNITGLASPSSEFPGKQLELLQEVIPNLSRVAVLWNPPLPAHAPSLKALESSARAVGIQVQPVAVHRPDDFEGAFAAMHAGQAEALIIFASALHSLHFRRLATLALTSRLPAIARDRQFAEGGLLMAYGQSPREIFLRAAAYVDKILKGAKPADLPVEQPMRFEFFLNLKTAQALRMTMPPSLLLLADEVIQ